MLLMLALVVVVVDIAAAVVRHRDVPHRRRHSRRHRVC